jgi:hypothetical protein
MPDGRVIALRTPITAWLMVLLVVAACTEAAPPDAEAPDAALEAERAVVHQFNDALNEHDVDSALALLANEVTFGDFNVVTDRDAMRTILARYQDYSECLAEIEQIEPVAESFRVTYRLGERQAGECPRLGETNSVFIRVEDGLITRLP